jgi:hypothetical protein
MWSGRQLCVKGYHGIQHIGLLHVMMTPLKPRHVLPNARTLCLSQATAASMHNPGVQTMQLPGTAHKPTRSTMHAHVGRRV